MRFLKRLVTWSVVLLLAVALGGYLVLRGSLPQLDGHLQVDHIRADILIERDASGIPSITAGNRDDLAYATGFVHGQDRFFQMDLSRRRAAGELAVSFLERLLCRSTDAIVCTDFAIAPARFLLP